MTTPVVAGTATTTASGSGPFTINKPSGSVAGNLLLAFHTADNNSVDAMTAPSGWTLVVTSDLGPNALHMKVWSADGSVSNLGFGAGANCFSTVICARITGWDGAGLKSASLASTTASTSHLLSGTTPTYADDLLLRCAGSTMVGQSTAGGYTVPVNETKQSQVQSSTYTTSALTSRALSATGGTGTSTWTYTQSYSYVSTTLAVAGLQAAAITGSLALSGSGTQSRSGGTSGSGSSLLASETFSAANGAAWPNQWTTVAAGGGTADVQSNTGRLLTAASAYALGPVQRLTGMASAADVDVVVDFTTPNASTELYAQIGVRDDGTVNNCYSVNIFPFNGASTVGVYLYQSGYDTALSGDLAAGAFTSNVARRIRFQVQGSNLRLRVWDTTATEPATWLWTGTNTAITTAGKLLLSAQSGNDSVADAVYWDNVTVNSFATSTSYSGSVALSGPGALTNSSGSGGTNASGFARPQANRDGWLLQYTTDFDTAAALGTFPASSAYSSRFDAYNGFLDTSQRGTYNPTKTTFVADSKLQMRCFVENGTPYVSAPVVRSTDGTAYSGQVNGRFSCAMRAVREAGTDGSFKAAFMLWPSDDQWPQHGEYDYPETDFSVGSYAAANHHRATNSSTDVVDTYVVPSTVSIFDWHVYTIEWTPTAVRYYYDDILIGTATNGVSIYNMRWTLQCETSTDPGQTISAATKTRVEVDWVSMWSYSPSTTGSVAYSGSVALSSAGTQTRATAVGTRSVALTGTGTLGLAGPSSNTTYATETFPGANGTAWPSQWQLTYFTSGSSSQVNNRGQMTTGTSTYASDVLALLPNMASAADQRIVFDLTTDANNRESYSGCMWRATTSLVSNVPSSCYGLFLSTGESVVRFYYTSSGNINVITDAAFTFSPGVNYSVEIISVATSHIIRVWATSGTKPATPTISTTNALVTAAGKFALAGVPGGDASPITVSFDNVLVESASSATNVTGSVALSGAGTLARAGAVSTATYSGSVSLSGSGYNTRTRTTSGNKVVPDVYSSAGNATTSTAGVTYATYRVTTTTAGSSAVNNTAALYVPATALTKNSTVLAFYNHGYTGASAVDGARVPLRDRLLDAGYIVICPEYEGTFGNANGMQRLRDAYSWVTKTWLVSDVVMFGESMGGATTAIAVGTSQLPNTRACVIVSPLLNLGRAAWQQAYSQWADAANNLLVAWDATDATLEAKTLNSDPMRLPVANYNGTRFYIVASDEDQLVPPSLHANLWVTRLSSRFASYQNLNRAGGHVSDQQYDTSPAMYTFLSSATTAQAVSGSVALSGSGTQGRAGVSQTNNALLGNGSGVLLLSAAARGTGTVALTGFGTLQTVGGPRYTGSLVFAGSGTLATAGDKAFPLAGSGSFELAPWRMSARGLAALDGAGQLLFPGGVTRIQASAALSGPAVLAFAARITASGSLSLSGSGAWDGFNGYRSRGTAALGLKSSSVHEQLVLRPISYYGEYFGNRVGELTVAGVWDGTQLVAANMEILLRRVDAYQDEYGSLQASGIGRLRFSSRVSLSQTALDLDGQSGLTLTQRRAVIGLLDLSGSGALTRRSGSSVADSLSLLGGSNLTRSGSASSSSSVALTGAGTLTIAVGAPVAGSGALSGSGTLTRSGAPRAAAALSTLGSGSLALSAGSTTPTSPTGQSGSWTVDFQDEFPGTSLDSTKWISNRQDFVGFQGAFNPDLENASFHNKNVLVADGSLSFRMLQEANTTYGVNYAYSSGTVSTEGKYAFGRGTFVEARIYVPQGSGLWPAFWCLVSGTYPPEADIFEFFDSSTSPRPAFNYHPVAGGQTGPTDYGVSGTDYRNGWHVYGMYRDTAGNITPYLDGVAYTAQKVAAPDTYSWFIVLNMSLYRNTTPPLTDASRMRIDWVRAWKPV